MAAPGWSTSPYMPRRTRDRSAQGTAERFTHGSFGLGTLGQSRNAVSVAPEVAAGPADDVPVVDSQGTGEERILDASLV